MRVHRVSVLVLLLVLASSATGFGLARSARDDNERRLLDLQAGEMTGLLQSLGDQYQTSVSTASVLSQRSGGDPAEFTSFVTPLQQSQGGSWFLLHRDPSGLSARASVGAAGAAPVLSANHSPAVDALLDQAFQGKFVVIGIFGSGSARALAMAGGALGTPGDDVTYLEFPLLAAAASSPSVGDPSFGLNDLDLALYIGAPTSENLVFATSPSIQGHRATRQVSIGSATVTVEVAAKKPLSGSVTSDLPWILLAVGLFCGGTVFITTELTLRRGDRALRFAAELADKNEALDSALADRDEAARARAALEDELRQSQRLDAVGQLAGGIAHDFNNLLTAILSFADLARDELDGHPAQADIDEIRIAARRGATLTRQLLLFSKHERGQPEPVDVNAAVQELNHLLARTLGEDVRMETDLQPELPPVLFEPGELEQVVMNLVVNARDAVDGAGTITVRTETIVLDADASERPSSLEPGAHVRLSVTDTGPGIAPDVLSRIFEPFFTTKERGRGTGLGLATVYGIVQRAHGHITARSHVGEGASFEVLLPEAPTNRTERDSPTGAGRVTVTS